MTQSAPVCTGKRQELGFHVEHTPVKKSAALVTAPGDKRVRARLETYLRVFFEHASQAGGFVIVDPGSPGGDRPRQSNLHRPGLPIDTRK